MAKYIKRPIVVEAEQWFPGKYVPGVFNVFTGDQELTYVVTIHEQKAFLDPGDWVIREPDDLHYYPCKPAIFEVVYESVGDGQTTCAYCGRPAEHPYG